ncbi:MAG TPA: OmpA family protein [Polyangiaceae bacterium]|nr:OmpA family protein [Polyangiaceae bacterium]
MGNRFGLGIIAFSLTFGAASKSHAEGGGFALNHYSPAERGSDWFALESLDLRGRLRPAVGLTLDAADDPLIVSDSSDNEVGALVSAQVYAHLGASLVLADRLRFGLNLPVQLWATGESVVIGGVQYSPPAHATALGDLRLGADFRLFGRYGGAANLALEAQVYLPTGDMASYSGYGNTRVVPRTVFAGETGPFMYAARVGLLLMRSRSYGGSELGNHFEFGGACGLRLLERKLVVGPELFGSTVISNGIAFTQQATPLEGLLGAHYSVAPAWRVGAAVSGGLTAGFGTPKVRGLLSVDWAPAFEPRRPSDRDRDQVPDEHDACPDLPGARTSNPLSNGCPPPADRDADGVPDAKDACPDVAGVNSEDPARSGCLPDLPCPEVPGPKSSDPRLAHCPTDQDQDGVRDPVDACPMLPGRWAADAKTNGCPEPDTDGDAVLDANDACPEVSGPANEDPKRNGCPAATVQGDQIVILDSIQFKTGRAELADDAASEQVLQAILSILTGHPEITRLHVEGHTDNHGAAAMNRQLSGKRAAAVVDWLVSHGVAANRLASAGFGADRPVDSNQTEAGRKRNRRVEFHIERTDSKQ